MYLSLCACVGHSLIRTSVCMHVCVWFYTAGTCMTTLSGGGRGEGGGGGTRGRRRGERSEENNAGREESLQDLCCHNIADEDPATSSLEVVVGQGSREQPDLQTLLKTWFMCRLYTSILYTHTAHSGARKPTARIKPRFILLFELILCDDIAGTSFFFLKHTDHEPQVKRVEVVSERAILAFTFHRRKK